MSLTTNTQDTAAVLKELRAHAWDYFELHADQRLRAFHFYILLETGLVAGLLLASRGAASTPAVVVIVGLLMILFSFVFWKLDFRTKGMIKVSEEALKLYERRLFGGTGDAQLIGSTPFLNEAQTKGLVGLSPLGTLSYSKCFGIVFIAFALVGLAAIVCVGAITSVCR